MQWFCALLIVAAMGIVAAPVMAEEAAVPAAQTVESSLIKSVSYDAATSLLTVVLEDNSTYEYKAVPETVYQELMAAESKGSYFVKNIKGKFEFTKK